MRASGWYWVRINDEHPYVPTKYNAISESWQIGNMWFKDEELMCIDERRILRAEN